MQVRRLLGVFALSGAILFGFSSLAPAWSESLYDALRSAYRNNPDLNADRQRQRVTDELVPTAKSGWRPTITAQGAVTQTWSDTNVSPSEDNLSKNLNIQLSQPIFRGFKTVEGVKSAKATVEAGRQALLGTEQAILFNAVRAYMSVVRDRQILGVRQKNVSNLKRQAQAASARFEVGEVTRTDVSQARARVSGADANAAVAKSNLESSIANYVAVIGKKPGTLNPAKTAKVPKSLERALSTANETNPNILTAAFVFDAAGHDVEVAKGDLLPQIDLQASASITGDPSDDVNSSESATIQGVVTVPIYQGGREYSNVRRTKQLASQRQIEIISATRSVREQVTASWYALTSSRQSIISARAQVAAAALALDGINQEYQVGSRTTIDVLNAEQELLSARIGQITAEHDQVVVSYQLLAAIGHLTARHIGLGGAIYDPKENYDTVKDKWFGLDADPVQ